MRVSCCVRCVCPAERSVVRGLRFLIMTNSGFIRENIIYGTETGSFLFFWLSSKRFHLSFNFLLLEVIFWLNFMVSCFCVCVCRRVEEVVRYSGLPPRRQLTYQAEQTISRETEQEKMRRAEQLMLQRNPKVMRCQIRRVFCLTDCGIAL